MSYLCYGKKTNKKPCKMKVTYPGEFCDHHISQQDNIKYCKCNLSEGGDCPMESIDGELCKSHQDSSKCAGREDESSKCDRYVIREGRYCSGCQDKSPIVTMEMKNIVTRTRQMMIQKHGPIIHRGSAKKIKDGDSNSPPLDIKIKIAPHLVKSDFDNAECPICLDDIDLKKKNSYRVLICGHKSHLDCLGGMNKFECPLCRFEIPTNSLPQTIVTKIEENMEQYEKERDIQEREDLRAYFANETPIEENSVQDEFHEDFIELATYLYLDVQTGRMSNADAVAVLNQRYPDFIVS